MKEKHSFCRRGRRRKAVENQYFPAARQPDGTALTEIQGGNTPRRAMLFFKVLIFGRFRARFSSRSKKGAPCDLFHLRFQSEYGRAWKKQALIAADSRKDILGNTLDAGWAAAEKSGSSQRKKDTRFLTNPDVARISIGGPRGNRFRRGKYAQQALEKSGASGIRSRIKIIMAKRCENRC